MPQLEHKASRVEAASQDCSSPVAPPQVLFEVRRCQFAELVAEGSTAEAVSFARTQLTPLAAGDEALAAQARPRSRGGLSPAVRPAHVFESPSLGAGLTRLDLSSINVALCVLILRRSSFGIQQRTLQQLEYESRLFTCGLSRPTLTGSYPHPALIAS